MKIDAILAGAISIILFGLALALPDLSSQLLFDFTAIDPIAQNVIRIGIILLGFYVLNRGLEDEGR